ncbi:MAG: hypothetical protein ACREC6_13045 [Hyphomicrobiaceae bacterium]
MASIVLWGVTIGVSVVALAAAANAYRSDVAMAYVHFAIAAATSVVFAGIAIRALRILAAQGASRSAIAAHNAQSMGSIWAWGTLAPIGTYGTGVLVWKEWWHFTLAFAVGAGLCFAFAAALRADVRKGRDDEVMLKLARIRAIVQLAGMVLVMAGLILDGKMTRFLTPRFTDWAANNIFFCGAMALAALSGYALRSTPKP